MDRVIFNASGHHGELTLQLGSSLCRCILFQFPRRERGKGWSAAYLCRLHTCTGCVGRKGGRERERKAVVDHMSSWLSNSKLKRGAISWGPISRKLVLSVGVTPLGGGRGGGGCCWEKQRESEGKLAQIVTVLEIVWDGKPLKPFNWQAEIDRSDDGMSNVKRCKYGKYVWGIVA